MDIGMIRPCSKSEAMEILMHESVLKNLAFEPAGIKDIPMYLVDEKALLVVMPEGEKAEIHIACKYRDRARMRGALEDILIWLKGQGFSEIFTTTPTHRAALNNMVKRMGFTEDCGRWTFKWA